MTLWALSEERIPVTGEKAIKLRDKGEKHSYNSPIYNKIPVTLRSGSSTLLVKRRAHFLHPEGIRKDIERRSNAEVGRIGIEAVLRDSSDLYEVGRGRLFREFDGYIGHREERVKEDTGFDVVYARQSRDGKPPIDYVVFVFDSVPNSEDYWRTVVSCSDSRPKNGQEKYIVRDGEKTPALGTGRSAKNTNGKVYVATVLIGDENHWSRGENSFVRDILMRTGLPVNYYDVEEGVMKAADQEVEEYDVNYTLAPVNIAKGAITVGTANPKHNPIPLGLAKLTEQTQKSLFSSIQGSLF